MFTNQDEFIQETLVINPLIYRINPCTGFRYILFRKENNVFYVDSLFLLAPRASSAEEKRRGSARCLKHSVFVDDGAIFCAQLPSSLLCLGETWHEVAYRAF